MRVILDANVVASAVCWNGEAYRCFLKLARRQIFVFGTPETAQESSDVAAHLIREIHPAHNATARLNWYIEKVKIVEASPLGKQPSRDLDNDPYLAAALAASANFIVSYDKDLLTLKKPFGIEIIRPALLLRLIKG
jgi:putative PIN family toxin of toxin-antitoxin system